MIYANLRQFIAVAALGLTAASRFYTEDSNMLRATWEGYKRDFNKVYHPSEETFRFGVFIKNLQLIDERNQDQLANGGEAVHGLTQFADITPEEFRRTYLGSIRPEGDNQAILTSVPPLEEGLHASKDWTGSLTTPVKNQGSCGSCWAFSAAEQIESDTMRTLGVSYVLSPQQLVSCDNTSFGCDGGWTEHAYNYVKRAGGIEQNSDYPYTSPPTGTCQANSSKFKVAVDAYYTISGESSMANHMTSTGPLSVCLDASTWSSYTGGIMTNCPKQVNHCVQAVGVDTSSAWKVRNSWGVTWGESGYIRLKYGQNTCNIVSDPTYVKVHRV